MIFLLLFGGLLRPEFCNDHLIADAPKWAQDLERELDEKERPAPELTEEQKDAVAKVAEEIKRSEGEEPKEKE